MSAPEGYLPRNRRPAALARRQEPAGVDDGLLRGGSGGGPSAATAATTDSECLLTSEAGWPFLAAAAVLTDFAADTLRPLGGGIGDVAAVGEMLIEHGEPIRNGPAKGRWTLQGHSRRAALFELARQQALATALQANHPRPDNPTQRAMDALLGGDKPTLAKRPLTDLLGLERALDLLGPVVDPGPGLRAQLLARIDRLRLLEPLDRLVSSGFAGRSRELATLRSHVDQLSSRSVGEFLTRGLDRIVDIFRDRPPLVVWGPGGVGKSTLLARFLLDHGGADVARPTPFVYLDFDRGQLDPVQPDSLLTEALRQIQAQFPEFADEAEALASDAQARLAVEDRISIARSSHHARSEALRDHFIDLINRIAKRQNSRVLLFIDTFEIVQRRGSTPVYNVLTLAARLTAAAASLRVVLAGRIPLRESDFPYTDAVPRWKPLPLGGFDAEAGRACLASHLQRLRLPPAPDRVLDQVVSLVQGNPLSLRLAADVFARLGAEGVQSVVNEARFEAEFTQERLQGYLHRRIVRGLAEPVQRLADPGLVVRRITPAVIQQVLAQPCGLDLTGPADAEALFDALQSEVALVDPAGLRTLRHRSDVRLLMLPLLRKKLGDKARRIDEAAAAYWHGQPGAVARAEQIYHLGWLEAGRPALEAAWSRGPINAALMEETLDELAELRLNPALQIWLSQKLGREIAPELEALAGQAEWEANAEQRARNLLASGAAEEALRALRSRSQPRNPASVLWTLELDALKLLGRHEEALALAGQALTSAREGHALGQVAAMLLQQSSVLERLGRLDAAGSAAARAWEMAQALDDPTQAFEALLAQVRLARLRGQAEELSALQAQLAVLVDGPGVQAHLGHQPALLEDAAAEIGHLRSDLLVRAAQLTRAGSDAHAELARLLQLGAALADQARLTDAVDPLQHAARLAHKLDDAESACRAQLQLGSVRLELRQIDAAEEAYQAALGLAQGARRPELELQALDGLGNAKLVQRDFEAATGAYMTALGIGRRMMAAGGTQTSGPAALAPNLALTPVAAVMGNLARLHLMLQQWDSALALLQESQDLAVRAGNVSLQRQNLATMADTHRGLGDKSQALSLYQRALAMANEHQDLRSSVSILCQLGEAYLQWGELDAAEQHLQRAQLGSANLKDGAAQARILGRLAALESARGDLPEAQALLQEQFDRASELNDPQLAGEALYQKALNLQALGEPVQAGEVMGKLLSLPLPPGSPLAQAAQRWLEVGEVSDLSGAPVPPSQIRFEEISRSVERAQYKGRLRGMQTLKR